ncbi:hypothetical protein ABIB57_003537 [Devosia sp. UYZn731]|uniref:HNH endonuclease signature motif containing protein n=1 Tax=Devosia sp. UYZn731 TaxID=3156345 RepID=UPI0033928309
MVSYVVNVRLDQVDTNSGALHLPRFSLQTALEAAGHDILLFASRDEDTPGYFGTAAMGDPIPDPSNRSKYWLPLHNQQPLTRVVTLRELRALGMAEMPFHTYSRPIRPVTEQEHEGLVTIGVIPSGFGEKEVQPLAQAPIYRGRLVKVQDRQLRFEMMDAYGPECAFTRRSFPDLSGLRYGTDVGHIWPRHAGGPDIIQNVLPMSKDVNKQWDEGLISLKNNGDLLIANKAEKDTRALFASFKRVEFPTDVRLWPDVKNSIAMRYSRGAQNGSTIQIGRRRHFFLLRLWALGTNQVATRPGGPRRSS